ncbi:MAG: hypothetical protein ACI8TS_002171, partial [Flavobacteriales bacterium]
MLLEMLFMFALAPFVTQWHIKNKYKGFLASI